MEGSRTRGMPGGQKIEKGREPRGVYSIETIRRGIVRDPLNQGNRKASQRHRGASPIVVALLGRGLPVASPLIPEEARLPLLRPARTLDGSFFLRAGKPSWFTPPDWSPSRGALPACVPQSGRRHSPLKAWERVLSAQLTASPRSRAYIFGPWYLGPADVDHSVRRLGHNFSETQNEIGLSTKQLRISQESLCEMANVTDDN